MLMCGGVFCAASIAHAQSPPCPVTDKSIFHIVSESFDSFTGEPTTFPPGTGFAVTTGGGEFRIITAAHVVADQTDPPTVTHTAYWACAPTARIELELEADLRADVATTKNNDVAILSFKLPNSVNKDVIPLRVMEPRTAENRMLTVRGIRRLVDGVTGEEGIGFSNTALRDKMTVNGRFVGGYSGSPVRNENNEAIGLITNVAEDEASKSDVLVFRHRIKKFLEEHLDITLSKEIIQPGRASGGNADSVPAPINEVLVENTTHIIGRVELHVAAEQHEIALGTSPYRFSLHWSSRSADSAYLYKNAVNATLAADQQNSMEHPATFKDILMLYAAPASENSISVNENQFGILQNSRGYVAVIEVLDIVPSIQPRDFKIRFNYWLSKNLPPNFQNVKYPIDAKDVVINTFSDERRQRVLSNIADGVSCGPEEQRRVNVVNNVSSLCSDRIPLLPKQISELLADDKPACAIKLITNACSLSRSRIPCGAIIYNYYDEAGDEEILQALSEDEILKNFSSLASDKAQLNYYTSDAESRAALVEDCR